jgi:protein-tyrosine phosphatase
LPGGREAPPQVVAAASRFGVDLSEHTSAQLSTDELALADVVITMTRQQLREVVLALPGVWPQAFTLPELVRRGERVGPRRVTQSIAEWIAEVHHGRRREEMIGAAREDDIADPYGGPDAGYRRMATTLADLVDRLGLLLWPEAPTGFPAP